MAKQPIYSFDAQTAAIERKRKLAEALMGTAGPQGTQMAGGMAVKQGPLEFLTPLLSQVAGRKVSSDADTAETKLFDERTAKLSEWLKNMPGTDPVQPVMTTTGFSTAAGQKAFQDASTASAEADQRSKLAWALQGNQLGPMGQAIGGATLQSALAAPEIKYQDLGDRIGILQNGQLVGSIAKGASADARMQNETTRRGQDLTALTTTRGQDITARGQDLSSSTAIRGQDLQAQVAAAGRATTERGQDISAGTAMRGQDIQQQIAKEKAQQNDKTPLLQSLEYSADKLKEALRSTPSGGPGGLRGRIGSVIDFQDAARVQNLRQQLSTDLRATFRIPGEGELSDQEQQQYGLQLPDTKFDYQTNEAIITDLLNRARLRAGKPIQGGAPTANGASGSWAPSNDGWSITEE